MKNEVWKDIKGYNGAYKISNYGNIRSYKNGRYGTRSSFRVLKPKEQANGYLSICLSKNGDKRYCYIHRLVAKAFIPNPENKNQVNHKNGIKTDNRASNIEWCTPKENTRHSFNNGLQTMPKGENSNGAILTKRNVLQIRSIYNQGWFTQKEIANAYNISRQTVGSIINRVNWTHL